MATHAQPTHLQSLLSPCHECDTTQYVWSPGALLARCVPVAIDRDHTDTSTA